MERPGERPACDAIGSVLPYPFAFGMGYFFSSALARWLTTEPGILSWVASAAGPTRNELQWQHYEDVTTGYWLSHAPFPIAYISANRFMHDIGCHTSGARTRDTGAFPRPPSAGSIIVHALKKASAFNWTWSQMWPTARDGVAGEYVHKHCVGALRGRS